MKRKILFILVLVVCFMMLVVPCFAVTDSEYVDLAKEYMSTSRTQTNYVVVLNQDTNKAYIIFDLYDKKLTVNSSNHRFIGSGLYDDGTSTTYPNSCYTAYFDGTKFRSNGYYLPARDEGIDGNDKILYSNYDILVNGTTSVFFSVPIARVAEVLPQRVAKGVPILIPVGLVIFSILLLVVLLKRWGRRFLPH